MGLLDRLREFLSGDRAQPGRRGGRSPAHGRDPGEATVWKQTGSPSAEPDEKTRVGRPPMSHEPYAPPQPHAPRPEYPPPVEPPRRQPTPSEGRAPRSEPGPARDPEATDYGPATQQRRSTVVAVLVGISGKLEGEVYPLTTGKNTLGRNPEKCSVVLSERDHRISRVHALIEHDEGEFVIESLNPANPTVVADEEVEGTELLPDRAVIRMGQTDFKFLVV